MEQTEASAKVEAAIARWWGRHEAEEVLPDLVAGLADPRARSLALRGLRLLGPHAEAALPELLELLAATEAAQAPEVACTVAMVAPAHPAVAERLVHGSEDERWRVALALAEQGCAARGAEPALLAATADGSAAVRWAAAAALWSVAQRADVAYPIVRREALCRVLWGVREHELDDAALPRLREMWPGFVGLLAEIVARDRSRLEDLRQALAAPDPIERLNACRVVFLVDGASTELVAPLRRTLAATQSFPVFVAACELLAGMGPAAAGAAGELERRSAAAPPLWREHSQRALEAIRATPHG